ncbi:salt tolerance down-regulator-domain-containing protein [Aspergillus karnatakaensis]|uniref:putative stress response protein Nst1 n=1 Tax=Aspergillus karnatakaensis TaxID=1810916 RepID=UPI003CCE505F
MPTHATPGPTSSSTMSSHVPATAPTRSTSRENSAMSDSRSSSIPDPKLTSANRKKQKRRQRAARMEVTREAPNGDVHGNTDVNGTNSTLTGDRDLHEQVHDDGDNTSEDALNGHRHDIQELPDPSEYHPNDPQSSSRKTKKRKGKKGRNGSHASSTPLSTPSISLSHTLPPPLPPHFGSHSSPKSSKERSIWNTSTQEERENIKTFWLELGEEDRRQLVKVEKDAVLKKMKEQQKHSCSCTVCGRKRTAIEEELEVLYDAYYEELEQYANNTQGTFERGPPMIPPPRLYQPPLRPPGHHTHTHGQFHPSRGRVTELPEEEDEDLEEDYDEEEEDDEPYSDEEYEDEETRAARADFFAFGNSLTVKDGILTVADDLLKNDGKHFIDMMEQLAERRMQREEDTQYGIAAAHQSLHSGHNHGPLDDEDYDDEEDEDYDSQEEEEYEEDEMDAMTEEQRMEEGRRMFQIFAARMFEQRVLTAYREKVAEQRQQKLLEELLEEENLNEQRNAKKAREAQKRKDKKKLQKQAKDEEKARKEAEKAAEEAAAKAEQERKLEEQRKKKEEQRKKREAERKAQEEERARKEAERQKRLREERDKQAEAERRQREQKEQEKKRREEARRKEREERELKEQRAKQERERKAREEQARREREKAEREDLESQAKKTSVPTPTNLFPAPGSSGYQQSPLPYSPTPVGSKAPTPAKGRRSSQQGSHSSSPRSQSASAEASQVSPRSVPLSQSSGSSVISKYGPAHTMLHHPHPSTPMSPIGRPNPHPPGLSPSNPPGLSGLVPRPPMGHDLPTYPPHSSPFMNQLRGFPAPNGIPAPPGMNGTRPIPPGRGFPLEPPGLPYGAQPPLSGVFPPQPGALPHGHSRQPSNSFERSPLNSNAQPFPITRPSPIKRPPSSQQEQHRRDVDDLSTQLGSSALLDDTDIPLSSSSQLSQSLPGPAAASMPGPSRASFAGSSLFPDPLSVKHSNFPVSPVIGSNTWGAQMPFGASFPGGPTWGYMPGNNWTNNNAFGTAVHHRAHTSRPVAIRLLLIQACKQLSATSPNKDGDGYHKVQDVLHQVEQLQPPNEPPIPLQEMLDICDTEGNPQNGGGSFSLKDNDGFVKFEPDTNSAAPTHRGSIAPGEIGSPIPSSTIPALGGLSTPPSSFLRQYSSPTTGF